MTNEQKAAWIAEKVIVCRLVCERGEIIAYQELTNSGVWATTPWHAFDPCNMNCFRPELCDKSYCDRLRKDYPEAVCMSDEELIEYYNEGRKYSVTWDHIGDSYEEYERLADSYLRLEKQITRLKSIIESDTTIGEQR